MLLTHHLGNTVRRGFFPIYSKHTKLEALIETRVAWFN